MVLAHRSRASLSDKTLARILQWRSDCRRIDHAQSICFAAEDVKGGLVWSNFDLSLMVSFFADCFERHENATISLISFKSTQAGINMRALTYCALTRFRIMLFAVLDVLFAGPCKLRVRARDAIQMHDCTTTTQARNTDV